MRRIVFLQKSTLTILIRWGGPSVESNGRLALILIATSSLLLQHSQQVPLLNPDRLKISSGGDLRPLSPPLQNHGPF